MKFFMMITMLFFFLLACSNVQENSAAQVGTASGNDNDSTENVALVNGVGISRASLDESMRIIKAGRKKITPEVNKVALDELIRLELVIQETKNSGLYDSREIQRKVRRFHENLAVESFIKNEVQNKIFIKDDDVSKYYEKNADKLFSRESVHAAHILVKDEEKLNEVLSMLKKGEKFEDVAVGYSEDPGSASKGGDLGKFGKGMMVPEFEKIAFSTGEGEIASPIKTKFGYHIIKVYEKFPVEKIPFSEVENRIRNLLLGNAQSEAFRKFTDGLKEKSEIKILNPDYT